MCHSSGLHSLTPKHSTVDVTIPLSTGESMPASLAQPDEAGSAPAVLILNDMYGRSEFYDKVAALLADAGYLAVSPELFFRLPPLADYGGRDGARARRKAFDEQRSLSDIVDTLRWLRAHGSTSGPTIGVIGFCMGGTFALNLASSGDDLAAVAYYGFPAGSPNASLVDTTAPIDQINDLVSPVLAFWGSADAAVGAGPVEEYLRRAEAAGAPVEAEVHEGLGHGFMASSDPRVNTSWEKTLSFLSEHVQAR
jgi:dienelactone hydrolase